MKQWIKDKLREFLGIDDLQNDYNLLYSEYIRLLDSHNEYINLNRDVIRRNDAIVKQFDISVDHLPREDRSWAVVCINGKPEYVKFVDLSGKDARSIHDFLRRFEGTNMTIDSPIRYFGEWK